MNFVRVFSFFPHHIHRFVKRPHTISFKHAWDGVKFAFRTQPNFRFHVFAFTSALIAGVLFKISYIEFLAIILISGIVFSMEMINTALEALGDEVAQGQFLDLIKVSKDVSAGGVLLSAVTALVLAIVIFIPKLILALSLL
ncbi:MAG: diacylglycerol kinase family protein [bacterium]|nr:diacylglycerol kinase family protein [bacterium]